MAAMLSTAMDRLAHQDDNKVVTFIHAYPGAVNTGNVLRGWGDRRLLRAAMAAVATPLLALAGFSAKESAERTVYLLTSSAFGGNGVPLPGGRPERLHHLGG